MTGSPKRTPLLEPDVTRMTVIEQELDTLQPRLGELRARMEAIRHGGDGAWLAALQAWRVADGEAFALRDEWLQLQVVRSFLPICAMCEQMVGPTYLEIGPDQSPPALCLDCFDVWACDHDPAGGRRPPSHWIRLTTQEARERETARRWDQPGRHGRRPCWHCGEGVNDLGDAEGDFRGAQVVLRVAALAPSGTSPEIGQVCLLCVDHETGLLERWAEIERDLCDPARLRHERALHRWVRDGPGAQRRRTRSTAAELPAAPAQPAAMNLHQPPCRGPAGRR